MHKLKKKATVFSVLNYAFFTIISLAMIFPVWNVIVVSLADYAEYVKSPLMLWPKSASLDAYKYIFSTNELVESMFVTIFITIVGTALSLMITVCAAYALSKKYIPGRQFFILFVIITMFFNGGLIPTVLTVRAVGLYDSIWALILPTAVNTWYLIIMKNYFASFPLALEESARIDGADVFTILARIVIPLSKPMIATMILFYGVEKWNEWWNAMMFINDPSKYPLQLMLRNLIIEDASTAQMLSSYVHDGDFIAGESTKMATAVVAILPITIIYPFLQKHFAKGVMVGAIKS